MDVFQGKKGSKVKINIDNFDLVDFSDFVMVFEGTPSYKDVKESLLSPVPGCPTGRNSPEKNKKQLRKDVRKWINEIKRNQIILGFEFIAVSLMKRISEHQ